MGSQGLNAASIALSVVSLIFFVVGCVGFSKTDSVLKSVAWITSHNTNIDAYFGLRAMYFSVDALDFDYTQTYDDVFCSADYCDKCHRTGLAALGLIIVAIIFSFLGITLGGATMCTNNRGCQAANVIVTFISALTSLIGFGLFMNVCYNQINDDFDKGPNAFDLAWGPGAILAITGMLLMWVVVVLQIAAAVVGGTSQDALSAQRA